MLGFSLAKLQDLDYDGHFKHEFALVPGYWYYFSHGHFRYGMLIHLCCILPAGILVVFQFVPVIRHKFILFHRINGYIVTLLGLVSNLSAFVVIRHDQGGGQRIAAQSAEYLMGIITTVGLLLAVYNVRRKQIDQHRAWMLRTWFWMGVTITARLINLAATPIITRLGHHWAIWTCDEIDFLYKNMDMPFPESTWPECFLADGSLDVARRVAVHANENSDILPEIGLSYTITFGTMVSQTHPPPTPPHPNPPVSHVHEENPPSPEIRKTGQLANFCRVAMGHARDTHRRRRAVPGHDAQGGRAPPPRELREAARGRLPQPGQRRPGPGQMGRRRRLDAQAAVEAGADRRGRKKGSLGPRRWGERPGFES